MEKKPSIFFTISLLAIFPISYFAFSKWINFDTLSAILFVIIIGFLILRNRKILDVQVMLKLFEIPLIYAVLWRTKFGLKFMDRVSAKYREFFKLLGYCFIGFGFFGLIFISINIIILLFNLFMAPIKASQGVSLVLPLTNIPGIGYLSFWHFLITIFLTVLVHEFAHGIIARAHNVPVKSSGLGAFSIIVPIFPLAFVEPDEKKLEKDKDIVQYSIFAAGPMANVILAVLVLLLITFVMAPIETNITHPIGFSFAGLMANYSAQEAGMQPGMIINSTNSIATLDYQTFSDKIGKLKPGDKLVLGTTNGSSYTVTAKPSPDNKDVGYIGILTIQNERRINDKYSGIGGIFFWLQGLFRWLYFINLAIGLMNLLPIIITDGGRMLKVALEKILGDAKKADKAWIFIGAVFIFTLLFALVVRYSFGLFKVLGFG